MAAKNFIFRMTSEGGQQVIDDLKSIAATSPEAERALRALTQASGGLASVADGVQLKIKQVAAQMVDHGAAANQAAFATRQFGVQSVQLFSSIATGAPVMTAFIQQGHQMVDVALATGTGFGVLGNAAKAVASAIASPAGAAALTVAAIGALIYAADNAANRIGTLRNQLSLVRTDFAGAATAADQAAKHLAATSFVNTADARAGINSIYAQGNLFTGSPQQAEALVLVNERLSRQLGEVAVNAQRAGEIVANPAGVLQSLLKDHPGIDAFDQQLVDHVRNLQEMNKQGEALQITFDALTRLTRNQTDATTPLRQAWHDIEQAVRAAASAGSTWAQPPGTVLENMLAGPLSGLARWLNPSAPSGDATGRIPTADGAGSSAFSSRGFRNNNPLNLSYLPGQGAIGSDGRFGIYGSMADGLGANAAQLLRYQDVYGLNTVGGIINRWAPAGENDPGAYAATVARAMGVGANDNINLHNDATMNALIAAMSRVENGPNSPNPFSMLGTGSSSMAGAAMTPDQTIAAGAARLGGTTAQSRLIQAQSDVSTANAALQLPGLDADHVKMYGQALDEANKRLYEAVTASDAAERSLGQQTSAEQRVADAWGQGAVAAAHVTNQIKAESEARGLAAPGTAQYAALVARLTTGYDALAATQQRAKLAEASSVTSDQVALMQKQIDTIGMETTARQALIDHMKNQQDVARQDPSVSQELRDGRVKELDGLNAITQALQRQQTAVDELANVFSSSFDQVGNAITQTLASSGSAAVNWQNVMQGVAQQVMQGFLKLAVLNPILNSLFGGNRSTLQDLPSSLGGGLFGKLFGSSAASTALPANADALATYYDTQFASGGIMTRDGPVPLRNYAGGGIASSPQAAIFGEGSMPEAYVPLPDGRSIPVSMRGGGGYNHTQVTVNVANSNASPQLIGATVKTAVIEAQRQMIAQVDRGGTVARKFGRRR